MRDLETKQNRKDKIKEIKLSRISSIHYFKLVFRSLLFLAAIIMYFAGMDRHGGKLFDASKDYPALLIVIWVVFAMEIILRFFPSSWESMGCQKQFSRNYLPTGNTDDLKKNLVPGMVTFAMAAAWFALNGAIGCLYLLGVIDQGIMLLVSLAYSVCDMICILFFCPFQSWFMKNKCCGSCRIYNWDYAMMFTPLVFIPGVYTWSLLALALMLLARWEVTYKLYPERFYEVTNKNLACVNCREKLCHHKKQLRRLWASIEKKRRNNAD